MKKYLPLFLVPAMLTSCVALKPYEPTPLNENAKGITTVKSTPYGCKVLGEVEGRETWERKGDYNVGNTNEVKEGALNDLRNKAYEAVGSGKRITLRIIDEKAICVNNEPCDPETTHLRVKSYEITAQVFECGTK